MEVKYAGSLLPPSLFPPVFCSPTLLSPLYLFLSAEKKTCLCFDRQRYYWLQWWSEAWVYLTEVHKHSSRLISIPCSVALEEPWVIIAEVQMYTCVSTNFKSFSLWVKVFFLHQGRWTLQPFFLDRSEHLNHKRQIIVLVPRTERCRLADSKWAEPASSRCVNPVNGFLGWSWVITYICFLLPGIIYLTAYHLTLKWREECLWPPEVLTSSGDIQVIFK